ncbi:MAG: GNAT family N-acetyltransferase, partial [Dehalococcoidia bacterium]
FRRRGRGRAAGARLVEHCLDHGLEPCWDAHNPPSTALAEQLGFVDPQRYAGWEVR